MAQRQFRATDVVQVLAAAGVACRLRCMMTLNSKGRTTNMANVSVEHKTPDFLKILLDTSFSDFLALKLIKFFYILGCIVFGIGALIAVWEYTESFLGRIAGVVILWPILFIVAVVIWRVWLELVAAIFRIAENTTEMAGDLNRRQTGPDTVVA